MPREVARPRGRQGIHGARVPFIPPQLATLSDDAPQGDGWWHEAKYDGYRMQCQALRGNVKLISRNGLDWTHRFPDIAADLRAALKSRFVVLDGEIVVHAKGRTSFHALQSSLSDADTARAQFVVFDLLISRGADQRAMDLSSRRKALEDLFGTFPASSRLSLSQLLKGPGPAALARACKRGEEGIVSKRISAPYESGRSRSWLKVKCSRRQEFVVVGYTDPRGGRAGVGSLLLGVYEFDGVLTYSGRVGTGFSERELMALRDFLSQLEVTKSPLSKASLDAGVREAGKVHWVKPRLVVEASFTEWTPDGLLRHPVFQGIREDKKPTQVRREGK